MTTTHKKKLIEVSLPLEVINAESAREKSIRHGHPSTLHLYWSRKPLATARAVLFAQLVDDPSSRPEDFPTVEEQDAERNRLHELIKKLAVWENRNDVSLFNQAREEIRKSNGGKLPAVLDPFAGGGSIPLEAQRLGLESHASDLNPLAVLINKALIEIPPKFAGIKPVFPGASKSRIDWEGTEGLAEDIRLYGQWVRDEAEKRIGHLYPKVKGPDGAEHTVIAWKWARTVKSPNPANPIETPLVNSWWLSKKKGKEAWVKPSVVDGEVRYEVVNNADGPVNEDGTRRGRGGYSIADGTPFTAEYIKEQGVLGNIGSHLIAIIAEGTNGRIYVSATDDQIKSACVTKPAEVPDQHLAYDPKNVWVPPYGLTTFADLFTNRQLTALTTLSELVSEVRENVLKDAFASGMAEGEGLDVGGVNAQAYADAMTTYLALAVSRLVDRSSSLSSWDSSRESLRNVFARQAIPMVWDFAESNPLSSSSGSFINQVQYVSKVLFEMSAIVVGESSQKDAATREYEDLVISTDPPYYDNIGYSDLSDFFYVWLRRILGDIYPSVAGTMLTPKAEELVANQYRHGGKKEAEKFFIDGFNDVFKRIRQGVTNDIPMTVYYAYKQQDKKNGEASSTGWYTLLEGLINSGWEITATWPMRSELSNRMLAKGTNALASSIVLACRPRAVDAPTTTRRAFINELREELPDALRTLIQGSIAPVDLAQAAIGPGISVFSRYSRVREADGTDMCVKDALVLVNRTLDEVLGEQESEFDPDTRFSVKWYRQFGWKPESAGTADQLARASDTSMGALERGGIFVAKGGKARLVSPSQLDGDWDVLSDDRISVWEATVRLAAIMDTHGADKVAEHLPLVTTRVSLDAVKELGFLLFHESERKGDTQDALLFNGLVSAWSDVTEQARKYASVQKASQPSLNFDEEE